MEKERITAEMTVLMREIVRKPKCVQPLQPAKGENACLLVLYLRGGRALPGELAQETGVSNARIAAVLRPLESKGYLTRDIDPEDRRKIRVALTEEGRNKTEELLDQIRQMWIRIADVLGDDDMEALFRIMRKLMEASVELPPVEM